MELALGLGDPSKPPAFLERSQRVADEHPESLADKTRGVHLQGSLGSGFLAGDGERRNKISSCNSMDVSLQLHLFPPSPLSLVHPSQSSLPRLVNDGGTAKGGSSDELTKRLTSAVNQFPVTAAEVADVDAEAEQMSSSSGGASFFQMEFLGNIPRSGSTGERSKRDLLLGQTDEKELRGRPTTTTISEGDDEDHSGLWSRKKLRLSKQQSSFLEESFKQHHTLNPKQKLALAKQLNLSPRQVEVWFQNRRARTKLKQTEADCEYLKSCCERLTQENRRLHKEVQELRALKASPSNPHSPSPAHHHHPFFMHFLSMCPSCERIAPAAATTGQSHH